MHATQSDDDDDDDSRSPTNSRNQGQDKDKYQDPAEDAIQLDKERVLEWLKTNVCGKNLKAL